MLVIIYDDNLNSLVFLLKIFNENNDVGVKPYRINVRTPRWH
jgi:hypothetical protein